MISQPGSEQPEASSASDGSSAASVERLIERFGGIRPMADKLGVPVSTVQGWKKRASIPANREAEVRTAATRHGLVLDEPDMEAAFPAESAVAVDAVPAVAAAPAAPAAVAPAVADKPAPEPSAADAPTKSVSEMPAPETAAAPAAAPSGAEEPGAEEPVSAAPVPEQKATPAMTASNPPAAGEPTESPSPFADAPSPVAALGHAYAHGYTGAPPASGGSAGAVAVAAALLAIIGAGVAVTAPLWSPDFQAKSVQVDAVTARVGTLEKSLGMSASADASLADRLAALETSVGAIDQKVAALPAAQVAGAIAAGQLRSALGGAGSFSAELAAVKVSGIADEATSKALGPLEGRAAGGIPTRGQLVERFAWMVPDVMAADLAEGGSNGIGQRMMGWVSGVAGALRLPVSGATVDAQSTPALVARAGAMLERGELAAAADLISMLPGPAGEVAAPWLEDTRARLAADEASALIGRRVTAVLAVAGN